MNYKINEQERQALKGLLHLQRLIYLEALRPYMDYQTGVIGIQRGISYQSIAEALYIEPHQGYQSGSPSKDQIRRALKGLEKTGLIKLRSTREKLIIVCLLAEQDNCVQNKPATKPPSHSATAEVHFSPENTGNSARGNSKAASVKNSKAATPPVSGNSNTLSLGKRAEKISEKFQPSQNVIKKAQQQECPTALCHDELTKFICYHQAKDTRCCDWDAEFLRWLLMAKHYQKEKKHDRRKNSALYRSHRSASASAVARVIAAHQNEFFEEQNCLETNAQGHSVVVGEYD